MPDHLRSFSFNPARRCSLHSGIWEHLADALFWLQLCWVVAGFLLMIYLAIKVLPRSEESKRSRTGTSDGWSGKRGMVVLGGYRFEITQDQSGGRPSVIQLHPDRLERRRSVR
jgi:hypothetical protein